MTSANGPNRGLDDMLLLKYTHTPLVCGHACGATKAAALQCIGVKWYMTTHTAFPNPPCVGMEFTDSSLLVVNCARKNRRKPAGSV